MGLFVSHDAGFDEGGVFGEGAEEGVVVDFPCKAAHEQAKVGGIPFQESLIIPDLSSRFTHDRKNLFSRLLGFDCPVK